MKQSLKISLLTLLSVTLISVSSYAQKKIKEGVVKYEVTDVEAEGGGMQAMMLKGSTQNLYFSDNYQKMEMSMMGMINIQIIGNNKDESSLMLMSGIMGKVKVVTDNQEAKQKANLPTFDISYDKKDVKTIAGYSCHRADLKDKDGNLITLYVTDKITPPNSYVNKMFKGLVGFPLEYALAQQGMKITYTAQEVSRDFDKNVFTPDMEGYEELTPEQLQEKFGGMNFGM